MHVAMVFITIAVLVKLLWFADQMDHESESLGNAEFAVITVKMFRGALAHLFQCFANPPLDRLWCCLVLYSSAATRRCLQDKQILEECLREDSLT